MTLFSGPFLPLAVLIWPLLLGALAALPIVRKNALRLLPLAPLPALVLALSGARGETVAPDLLLGVVLRAEPGGLLLLGMTALLWLGAGIFAQTGMAGTRHPAILTGFWCLTLAGNLGVFLAADVITFYTSFAAVSLAAYFLVIHERSVQAFHAGRVYIVMAVAGEACLLLGFLIGADAAGSLGIENIRAALSQAPSRHVAVALLIAGFGIKAGLVPLHFWLPLAHPAAPVPASAVLSGAIVKAGIIGMVVFLPDGFGPGVVLMALGFAGAVGGAVLGLTQLNSKTVLAYSTISQMGLVVALIGAALIAGQGREPALFYAFHHGLAKGALFLAVGLMAVSHGRWRWIVLAGAALVALSIAGAPLSGGSLVKAAAKPNLGHMAELAFTASGGFTTLVLMWFLLRLWKAPEKEQQGRQPRPGFLRLAPCAILGTAALGIPWVLWGAWSGLAPDYPLRGSTILAAVWPVGFGIALGAIAYWRRLYLPQLPSGDLLMLGWRLPRALKPVSRDWATAMAAQMRPVLSHLGIAGIATLFRGAIALEAALVRWRWSGALVLVLMLGILITAM